MSAQLARPLVRDLVFNVYDRALHPELFEVVSARQVASRGGRLAVRITRTGHIISWEKDGLHLTEVVAAKDESLPERGRVMEQRLRGERRGLLPCGAGVGYQMSFQCETLPADVFWHVQEELRADGRERGFLHNFPPHHRLALGPLSFVAVEWPARALLVHSFHTFPDEFTIVRSQSLIEWR